MNEHLPQNTRGNQDGYKARPFWYYGTGFSEFWPHEWKLIFAEEERKHGNPLFAGWRKVQALNPQQQKWVDEYWNAIEADSLSNYRRWDILKKQDASKDRLTAAWAKVWLREVGEWDKASRTNKPTGLWRSGRSDAKDISNGVVPVSGKSGGLKYDETTRPAIGVITARPKQDLLALVASRLGMSVEAVTERFNQEWKNKSRNLFYHHGGGVWSTVHKECMKIAPEELAKLQQQAKDAKRKSKGRTNHQALWWRLWKFLPKCVPNYDNPDECPVWKHIEADEERLKALREIQSSAVSKEKQEMPLPQYVHYLLENRHNFIRDSLFLPFYEFGKYRQGKSWYDVELVRNFGEGLEIDFRNYLVSDNFYFEDFGHIVSLAVKNGDLLVDKDRIFTGANTDEQRRAEKAREAEEQKRKAKELQKVHAVYNNESHWRLMTSRTVLHSGHVITYDRNEVIVKILEPWYGMLANPESHASKVWRSLSPQRDGFDQHEWLFENLAHWSEKGDWLTLKGYPAEIIDKLCEVAFHFRLVAMDRKGNVVGVDWNLEAEAA
jgi:hypothetical protein